MPYHQDGLKLDRMRDLLRRLDNPQHRGHTVHIAGTKGKGSTATFLSSMLRAAGYRTGCYTSPHLLRLEERFAVDGQPCTADDLVRLTEYIAPIVAQMDRDAGQTSNGELTFFEITTALAFLYFQWQDTQFTVLEVGLGGRLDSTNVCDPCVCVITSISFDHMRQLGNTLAAIAAEKAGIIKHHVPVVTGVTSAEPYQVIQRVAAQHHAGLCSLKVDFDFDYHVPAPTDPTAVPTMDFLRIEGNNRSCVASQVVLPALGQHQAANASLAWATCDVLTRQGFDIPATARRNGLLECKCPARVEVIRRNPTVVIDTAHNAASIQALVRVLRESFPERRRTLILAASRDKDVDGMLHALVPEFDTILCTPYLKNPRSMSAAELVRHARRIATAEGTLTSIVASGSPAAAWQLASAEPSGDLLICATGSFFLAAEMKELLGAKEEDARSK
jgi:dihydrofolate synthase/folylpolyglutamate synthase